MAVTVVVGGQFGSEGKGKVAQYLAAEQRAAAVVRVGGSNSGHTGFSPSGERMILRHLPTAALLPQGLCVIGPGSYVDVHLLLDELRKTQLPLERLAIDYRALEITPDDIAAEARDCKLEEIGSTCSGTGAAVRRRVERKARSRGGLAATAVRDRVVDTTTILRELLDQGERVIVEGTQGFGLSVLHSPHYPFVTSRDTSAAGAISEAGLSPLDVDQVVLVLRAFPIRVGGNSGPLPNEVTWETIRQESGARWDLDEFTSVTGRLRRVARFDPEIVCQAIAVNQPTHVVLNHIDHVDAAAAELSSLTDRSRAFMADVEREIGHSVDLAGLGPSAFVETSRRLVGAAC